MLVYMYMDGTLDKGTAFKNTILEITLYRCLLSVQHIPISLNSKYSSMISENIEALALNLPTPELEPHFY